MFDPDSPTAKAVFEAKVKDEVDNLLEAIREYRERRGQESNERLLREWRQTFLLAVKTATKDYTNGEAISKIRDRLREMSTDQTVLSGFTFLPTGATTSRVSDFYEPSTILQRLGFLLPNHSIAHSGRRISRRQALISGVSARTGGPALDGGYYYRI
ncbi:uncharacterized protein JCM6883_005093 [Sporobolomyces salmoneus]|uniref:uncharacterized protein n=1 Tax=Sporobolomyces salmoneus TaxID=183962 RepID=UPI0031720188